MNDPHWYWPFITGAFLGSFIYTMVQIVNELKKIREQLERKLR